MYVEEKPLPVRHYKFRFSQHVWIETQFGVRKYDERGDVSNLMIDELKSSTLRLWLRYVSTLQHV